MTTRMPARTAGEDRLFLVVNAACKTADIAHLRANLPQLSITTLDDRALLAIQGPKAAQVVAGLAPGVESLPFMGFAEMTFEGAQIFVTRSGYTGEDGFEISLPPAAGLTFANALLADPRVKPIGLGARDSLRLEAGLCLYGHDIDETTSPVEAGLSWSIGKRRRLEGGFPGYDRIARELKDGPSRKRVGLLLDGRQPAREGSQIAAPDGEIVGVITSGGFAPSLDRAIAMGYVASAHATPGTKLDAHRARQGVAGQRRRLSLLSPIATFAERIASCPRPVTRKITNTSASTAMWRRSASPITRRRNWVTWCSSNCPQPAASFKKGEQAAVVESVKAASEVYAPVSGEIVAVNSDLEGSPALVNEDSAGKGWFVKLRIADQGELSSLMDDAAYADYLKTLD